MDALGGTELSTTLGPAVVFALVPAVTIGGIDAVRRPGKVSTSSI